MANDSLLVLNKSFDVIMDDAVQNLSKTKISDVSAGSVSRLLLASINSQFSGFYDKLQVEHVKSFLSKADDNTLDLIGELLNCQRIPGETKENYRFRIHKQSLVLERANETALRLSVLSVPEVKDVVLKEYTHGTGSFSVYPIIDNPKEIQPDLLHKVQDIVNKMKAHGVRGTVMAPRLTPVEVRVRLLFSEKAPNVDRSLTRNQATTLVRRYVVDMKPGDNLSPDHIIDEIMKLDNNLIHVEIYHFTIGGKPMLLTDQPSAWNEQYIEADIPKAIVVS